MKLNWQFQATLSPIGFNVDNSGFRQNPFPEPAWRQIKKKATGNKHRRRIPASALAA